MAHKPRPVLLMLIAGSPPEPHRDVVLVGNDRGKPDGAPCLQVALALPQQLGGETLTAMGGVHHELVEAATPPIPSAISEPTTTPPDSARSNASPS